MTVVTVWQTELSSLRDTVNELEAAKASVQQELQHHQRLYVQQLNASNELRRKLHAAKQTAATSRYKTQPVW